MTFADEIEKFPWVDLERAVLRSSPSEVESALGADTGDVGDLAALLSPAADPYLEVMAQLAHRVTVQRFGRVIQMYAPLYVSSECSNACLYCGFNRHNAIRRVTLEPREVLAEARALRNYGFRHLLLVSGESPGHVSLAYLAETAAALRGPFSSLSLEVYPMETESYVALARAGVDGLTVYQETYHPGCYATVHPAGPKSDYHWRLGTPERGGRAGFRRLNVGALLGLSDWRVEGVYLGLHAAYLARRFWRSHVSLSFPRLRPAAGGYRPRHPVSDRHLVQLMCALRIWLPEAGLVLSTREPAELRDRLVPLGVTQMSAGSRTAPGGYTAEPEREGQFEVSDRRSPEEVADMILARGYEPLWKDWDRAFLDRSLGCA